MKFRRLALAVLLSVSASVHAADDFKTALQGATTAREAQPLAEKYVSEHPEAPDIAMAKTLLGQLYGMNGDHEKALVLLEKCYAGMPKGAKGDLRGAVGMTKGLVTSYIAIGDKKKAEAAVKRLNDDFKGHSEMDQAAPVIASIQGELNKPGKGDVMEVSFTDIDGHKVDLATLKGKVVLVDFWATWCGPCVGELPNVLKAYYTYHDKGFEVIGISLDKEEKALRTFIKDKKVPWPQYFDGKGWENALSTKFGIQSIPATFLIGKDGKVAATGLRGEALGAKLEELLK